jgi:quercetin dioxygenase-like cupin family protein
MRPYKDLEVTDEYVIREFDDNINPIELMWHRDLKSRKVTILDGKGWSFQKENELPLELNKGDVIFIKAKDWHRIFIGETNLKIKIEESN